MVFRLTWSRCPQRYHLCFSYWLRRDLEPEGNFSDISRYKLHKLMRCPAGGTHGKSRWARSSHARDITSLRTLSRLGKGSASRQSKYISLKTEAILLTRAKVEESFTEDPFLAG